MAEIKLAGVVVRSLKDADLQRRMSLLLWGASGCGKSTLAATAPGKKLWLNFDPDGVDSLTQFAEDIDVADYSHAPDSVMEQAKNADNPFGLKSIIEQYDTVVVDSMTNVAHKGLMKGIPQIKGASIERPSPGAYQVRNAISLQMAKNILRITGKYKKHCIIICHEAAPMTNDDGHIVSVTLMLGGQLPQQTSLDFSEVWAMTDTGRERRIAIRPMQFRKPMKSRMFITSGKPDFRWTYDADTLKGEGLADWYGRWQENKFSKIPIPS